MKLRDCRGQENLGGKLPTLPMAHSLQKSAHFSVARAWSMDGVMGSWQEDSAACKNKSFIHSALTTFPAGQVRKTVELSRGGHRKEVIVVTGVEDQVVNFVISNYSVDTSNNDILEKK